ncbi:hypothetical protein P7M41_25830, partial [Vibrio parahaemolyticus]|nr:hypothetical protein [Vibrio parahaemolyticus]
CNELNSVGETQICNGRLLYSAFLQVLITCSICFGEEETFADNSAPCNNLQNIWGREHSQRAPNLA